MDSLTQDIVQWRAAHSLIQSTPKNGVKKISNTIGNTRETIGGKHMSKYHSTKVKTAEGLVFDSKKEYKRFCELQVLEAAGIIKDLHRQYKFVLIPAQREPDTIGKRGGNIKGKLIERELSYIADFVYMQDGKVIVEDVKGYKGGGAYSVFKIKKKLMLYFHGIKVVEV